MSADIGLVGLAVMGENLVLNMERHGFTVAVFNRTTSRVDEFLAGRGKGLKVCFDSRLVLSIKPRSIHPTALFRCSDALCCIKCRTKYAVVLAHHIGGESPPNAVSLDSLLDHWST